MRLEMIKIIIVMERNHTGEQVGYRMPTDDLLPYDVSQIIDS